MKTYLVTYDLSAPGRNYEKLYEALRSYANWAHVLESVWVVRTSTRSAAGVRDHLGAYLDRNDKIFVTAADQEAAWRGLESELSDWLKKYHGEP